MSRKSWLKLEMPCIKLSTRIMYVVALIALSSSILDSAFFENTTSEVINRAENEILCDASPRIGCDENHQATRMYLGRVVDVQNNTTSSAASPSSLMEWNNPLKNLPQVVRRLSDGKIKQKTSVKIVVYDKIKGYLNWMQDWFILAAKQRCNTICTLTDDVKEVGSADIILFHGATHSFSYPEKVKNQLFVLLSMEQPNYATVLSNPKQLKTFDLMSTYSLKPLYPGTDISNLPISYYPLHLVSASAVLMPARSFEEKNGYGSGVSVALFTSNCHNAGATTRLQYLTDLMLHIKVHSYGRCLHNRDEPLLPDDSAWPPPAQRRARKIKILSQYKFALSFENMAVEDYVSEKVFEGLIAGSVPVYRGTKGIERFMPSPMSFIDANDMTPLQLATLLSRLSASKEEYEEYMAFKRLPLSESFANITVMSYAHPNVLCRLCDYAVELREKSDLTAQTSSALP